MSDEYEYTSKQMATKLMDFISFIDDSEEDLKEEIESLTETFDLLKQDERFNALAHHLDLMMMDDKFKSTIQDSRCIGLSTGDTMGDEIVVIDTDAPRERLKKLEMESCEFYTLEDYDNVPSWIEVLSKEGYKAEFVDFSPHVTPFHSSHKWLEEYFPDVEEVYYIEKRQLENEKKHELLVKNENLGDIEILNYDKSNEIALIRIVKNQYQPYVIAKGFDVSNGRWASGYYFEHQQKAEREYKKTLDEYMDESLRYQDAVKCILKEDMPDMNLKENELASAYEYLVYESESPTIINADDLENVENYINNLRYQKEKAMIQDVMHENHQIGKMLLRKISVKDWYQTKWKDDAGIANFMNPDLTFAQLDAVKDEENVYDILGVKDSVVLHRCLDEIREIKGEPYINFADQYMNQTFEGYFNQWSEFGSTVRNGGYYRIFENTTLGDETFYVVTDYECNPIGETYDDLETALDDILEKDIDLEI